MRGNRTKGRGQRAQRQPASPAETADPVRPPTAREARKGWATLLQQVYELDPLRCAKCGSEMKIIAFIEGRQTEVIEKIRWHFGQPRFLQSFAHSLTTVVTIYNRSFYQARNRPRRGIADRQHFDNIIPFEHGCGHHSGTRSN